MLPIVVRPSSLVLFLLVAISFPPAAGHGFAGVLAASVLFASILLHELAHGLVATRSGIGVERITFFAFGGMTELSEEPADPWTELRVALAGPSASLLVAVGGFAVAASAGAELRPVLAYLVWVNLALAVFNLAPGLPFDGGHALRAIWWWRTGSKARATALVAETGRGFALALVFVGALEIFLSWLGGLWLLSLGVYLWRMPRPDRRLLPSPPGAEALRVPSVVVRLRDAARRAARATPSAGV